jgi:hypothetical protein
LPQFYCMKTHHHPNPMQIHMPTIKDWLNLHCLDGCHCMSLPLASPYALACIDQNQEHVVWHHFAALATASACLVCSQKARYN